MSTLTSRKRELMTWHFALFTVIWYNIVYQINHVSKIVQSPSVSVETLQQETSTVYLEGFRENGLAASETYANEIVENQKTKSNLAVPV